MLKTNKLLYIVLWLYIVVIILYIIVSTLYGLTISGQSIEVNPNDYANVDNWATMYLLNIYQYLQLFPYIAMVWGWFYILNKIIWLFKNK